MFKNFARTGRCYGTCGEANGPGKCSDMEVATMLSKLYAVMGAIIAVGLVVAALWAWAAGSQLVARADRPELALWAVRSAAIAAIAGAQVLGLTFVVDAFYGRDRMGELMRVGAGLVCTAALVGAIAMGIVSR